MIFFPPSTSRGQRWPLSSAPAAASKNGCHIGALPRTEKKRPIDFFFSLLLLLLLLFEGRRNKKTGEMGNFFKKCKKKEFFFLAGTRFSTVRVDAALMMTTSSATLATEFVRPHPRPNTGLHFSRFRCAFYWI